MSGRLEILMMLLATSLIVRAVIKLDECLYSVNRAKAHAYCHSQWCAWLKGLNTSSWAIAPILSILFLIAHLRISPPPKDYEELYRLTTRLIDVSLILVPLLSTIYMALTDEALGLHKSVEFYLAIWGMNVLSTYFIVRTLLIWYCEFTWPRLLERQQEGLKRN